MTDSIVNRVAAVPPPPGHRIRVVRLDGTRELDLGELHATAGRLAAALRRLGVSRGDRIGIVAANCMEWVLLDLAALRLGAVTAGFEPGKFSPDAGLRDRYGLSLVFSERPGADAGAVRPLGDVLDLVDGETGHVEPVTYMPEDVSTIKFTSGSTGEPKGLAASVGSIDASIRAVQEMFVHGPGDDIFVFLPLSLLQQRYWVYSALAFGHDVTVTTYESAFVALPAAAPTVVMGVPAFFETARRQIEGNAARRGLPVPQAARLLFGDRVRYLWTGSAPASPAVLRFFTEAGLPIYEGYGLNETCIVAKNHPGAHRPGSVGRVLPGKRVTFDDDGLLSVASDQPVALRYEYSSPGESERVFGPGGVVRTGDVGYLDSDGFLFIRGRADDVIVLDNGRKVIVRPIEERIRHSPAVEHCVVYCPTQTHLVAVVAPPAVPDDIDEFHRIVATHLAATNDVLAPDERIRRTVVVPEPFTMANGLLTSQYKPRRTQILDRYRSSILASGEGTYVYRP